MQVGVATNPPILYAQPGWTTTQPGLTTTQPGLTTTQPGLTTPQPGLTTTQHGLTTTQPGSTTPLEQNNVNVLPDPNSQPSTDNVDRFPRTACYLLGATQLACGILCVIFQSVAIAVGSEMAVIGHGIWCGIFFALAGSFGLAAASCKTKCMIVTFMVFSIIAALLAPVVIILSGIGWAYDADECRRYDFDYETGEKTCLGADHVAVAMNAVLVCVAIVETVAAILSTITCCRAYCCCAVKASSTSNSNSRQKFIVVYVGNGADGNPAVINTQSLQSLQLQQPIPQVINAQGLQSLQLQQPIPQVINTQTLQTMQLQQPIAQRVTPVDPNQHTNQAEAPPQYDTLSTDAYFKEHL